MGRPVEVAPDRRAEGDAVTHGLLLYALTGGVVWWVAHLTLGSALANGVCSGTPRWLLTLNNVVCVVGVLTALAASLLIRRPRWAVAGSVPRARVLADVALAANAASRALGLLESLPVYVLRSCS